MSTNRTQGGFGLIEVLITLLVFSVGVLAVAGLQAVAKKNNYDALQRGTAANLASSMASSMRANTSALDSYLISTDSPRGSTTVSTPEVNCYQTDCTPAELAAFDLYQWELALNGAGERLPGNQDESSGPGGLSYPSACILGPPGGGPGFYIIAIAWRGITEGQIEQAASRLQTAQDCGTGRSVGGFRLYAPSDAGDGAADSYRRVFTLETYIAS